MRAVQFRGPGQVSLTSLPDPSPGSGQALLRVVVAGVCQTDVHIVRGHFPVRPPRVLGHEFVGEVVALGDGVSGLTVGEAVGVNPPTFCGRCVYCRRGQPQHCANFRCLGNTEDGGWAEVAVIRADQAVPLDGLRPEQAVWLEPLACVLRALDAGPVTAGSAALIIGAGPLGLLAGQAARALGARAVALVDPNPGKVERASRLGADRALVVEREGETTSADDALLEIAPLGFDFVLDTTGKSAAIARALRWAGRNGTVVLFGVSDPADQLTVRPAELFDKELAIRATAGATPGAFEQAVRVMRAGTLDTDALVWREVGLEALPETLMALMRPGEKGKVLVYPGR